MSALASCPGGRAYNPPTVEVFVSHPHSQSAVARELAKAFRDEGLVPWLAEEKIRPGESPERSVEQAIDASDAVVFLLDQAPAGRWQSYERQAAVAASWSAPNKALVAILLPGASSPPFMSRWLSVQLTPNRMLWSTSFRKLARLLKTNRPSPSEPHLSDWLVRLSELRKDAEAIEDQSSDRS
jgi:hypothetical protein